MAARHPALKNAPMEGSYAKGMQVNHKPFNEVVRYVLFDYSYCMYAWLNNVYVSSHSGTYSVHGVGSGVIAAVIGTAHCMYGLRIGIIHIDIGIGSVHWRITTPTTMSARREKTQCRRMWTIVVGWSFKCNPVILCELSYFFRSSRGFVSSRSKGDAMSSSGPKVYRTSSQFVDENGESDPEAEFLSTLTRREKKLLMQKLKV